MLQRYLPILKDRNVQLFMGGRFLSSVGSWVQVVGLGWASTEATKSEALIALNLSLLFVPSLFLGWFAGKLADSRNRIVIQEVCQWSAAALTAIYVMLASGRTLSAGEVLVYSLLSGIIAAFDGPAKDAFFPTIVSDAEIGLAGKIDQLSINLARLVGTLAGGWIVASMGLKTAFIVNAASFVICGLALAAVRSREPKRATIVSDCSVPILSFLLTSRASVLLLLMTAGLAFFSSAYGGLLPVFARLLGSSARDLSLLMFAYSLGAVPGLSIAVWLKHHAGEKQIPLLSLIHPLAILTFSATTSLPAAVAALATAGAGGAVVITLIRAALQELSPDRTRGRMMGVFSFVSFGLFPLGQVLAGVTSDLLGSTRIAVALFAGLGLLVVTSCAVLLRQEQAN